MYALKERSKLYSLLRRTPGGANSVLTKDISQLGVIVAGVPATIIRKMTPEDLERRMNKH